MKNTVFILTILMFASASSLNKFYNITKIIQNIEIVNSQQIIKK